MKKGKINEHCRIDGRSTRFDSRRLVYRAPTNIKYRQLTNYEKILSKIVTRPRDERKKKMIDIVGNRFVLSRCR